MMFAVFTEEELLAAMENDSGGRRVQFAANPVRSGATGPGVGVEKILVTKPSEQAIRDTADTSW